MFLSLFSGVGGFDLGLEMAGMECVGQVEIDPQCRQVLAHHWPDVWRAEDVRVVSRESLCLVDGERDGSRTASGGESQLLSAYLWREKRRELEAERVLGEAG
ncbi:MAG: DNA cytosine methyltransferase [Patescibacteria group bacterium]|nr:DNA cytosine methyltransferase [Patescibacteria group bacterium]